MNPLVYWEFLSKLDFVQSRSVAKEIHNLGRRTLRQFWAAGCERRPAKKGGPAPERLAHESQHIREGGILLGVPRRTEGGTGCARCRTWVASTSQLKRPNRAGVVRSMACCDRCRCVSTPR